MMGAPSTVLLAVLLAGFGWAMPWPEPARAGYVLQWVGFALLCSVLRHLAAVVLAIAPPSSASRLRTLRLACALGIGIAVAGAGCGAWYEALASQTVGVCDAGTGRPVTLAYIAAALAVVAHLIRENSRGDTPCR